MAKNIGKQVGDPCEDCGAPLVMGKKGPYCKPCYIQWAETRKQDWAKPQAKAPYTPEQAKSQEIRGFQENKEESMRLMSSGRDATLMVTAMMGQGSAWTDEQLKDKIKEWQTYFYTEVYVDDPLRGK